MSLEKNDYHMLKQSVHITTVKLVAEGKISMDDTRHHGNGEKKEQ